MQYLKIELNGDQGRINQEKNIDPSLMGKCYHSIVVYPKDEK